MQMSCTHRDDLWLQRILALVEGRQVVPCKPRSLLHEQGTSADEAVRLAMDGGSSLREKADITDFRAELLLLSRQEADSRATGRAQYGAQACE